MKSAPQHLLAYEEIEQLRIPAQNVLRSMRSRVKERSFKLLIGDDASGRPFSLILHRVLGTLYKKMGTKPPAQIFLRGHVNAPVECIQKFESDLRCRIWQYQDTEMFPVAKCVLPELILFDGSPEALIVTDAVQRGRSMRPLADVLDEENLGFEIATMQWENENSNPYGIRLHSGKLNEERKIYQRYDLIGVQKQKDSPSLHSYRSPKAKQATINEVRQDIASLSRDLVTWYGYNVERLG